MIYYYGIGQREHVDLTPQFLISYYAMKSTKKVWDTQKNWMLDSGGFTIGMREGTKNHPLNKIVEYPWSKDDYINFVNIWKPQVAWTMDYAVKVANTPDVLHTKQVRTIENTIYLKDRIQAPTALGAVLQGWENEDYLKHLDMYKEAGVIQPWFAIGFSLARLSLPTTLSTIIDIRKSLPAWVKFHGFSVKLATLNKYPRLTKFLYSADSAAWIANGAFHIPGSIQAGALNNFVEKMESKLAVLNAAKINLDDGFIVDGKPIPPSITSQSQTIIQPLQNPKPIDNIKSTQNASQPQQDITKDNTKQNTHTPPSIYKWIQK